MIHFKYEVIHVNQINNFSNSTAKTDKKHVINLNQIMKNIKGITLTFMFTKNCACFLLVLVQFSRFDKD